MKPVVGVMGSGHPLGEREREMAFELGRQIALHGWTLLTGGTACGVMDSASQGAHEAGGLVVGVLRSADGAEASSYIDVAIRTGLGEARDVVNVLSSDIVIALPGGAGTISEVALALKADRTVIVLGWDPGQALRDTARGQLLTVHDVPSAIMLVEERV